MAEARLQAIAGGAVPRWPLVTNPWQFQAACVDAFVASWRARGFSPVTVDNDIGLLERTLACLVNIEAKNLLNGNQVVLLQNVAVPVVAALCGVNVNVFSAQLNQGKANCPAQSNSNQLAWAVYN